ncbi:zincin-like metallopeptidase domain-containing protein (plasmid) [Aliarcobacter butzleri]|uniref:zincin-like metallopeptidase domain-containing protein n=1 Tax=Aliarcobacter butzleri TaxID=28197 RepID=UPI0021B206CB|nr:zincin-like metallopeptidase domain-containing protein [Aliarcobacter butzleri]UXC30723.1 zincin-like metallopeptidase domain-containing protein [Aliarcobacter butzleri]
MSDNFTKKSNYEQYQDYAGEIAELFYKALLNDKLRFTKSWSAGELQADKPHNPITRTVYKGLNSFTLDITKDEMNYSSNSWLTFNQIKDLGGYVKKGSKSMPISFFTTTKKVKEFDEKTGEEIEVIKKLDYPVFKKASVFNIDQVEGIDKEKIQEIIRSGYDKLDTFNNIEVCEAILQNVDLTINHLVGAGSAYYKPSTDSIHLPSKEQFKSEEAYYSVAFHELGHATGHEKRLGRDLSGQFGSESYAKEELRAEIYSYLQAKELGIAFDLENHQSYVKSWAKDLENNKLEIIEAVKDAMKMVKYVNEHYVNKDNVLQIREQAKEITPAKSVGKHTIINENLSDEKGRYLIDMDNIAFDKDLLMKEAIKPTTINKQITDELKKESVREITKDGKHFFQVKDKIIEIDIEKNKYLISPADYYKENLFEEIENSKGKNINSSVSSAITRSFTKSLINENEQEKKEDWEILKNNIPQTKSLLKDYIKQAETELKETKDFQEISNIKKDIQGYNQVIESLEKIENSKGKNISIIQTQDKRNISNSKYTEERKLNGIPYAQIPMYEIIKNAGFDIKREKSSANSITMSDGKDKIVIVRGKGKINPRTQELEGAGNYIYYNTNFDKTDKGTIFDFCEKRGIAVDELVKNSNIKEINHTLTLSDKKDWNNTIKNTYESLKSYNKSNENSLSKIRKIKSSIIDNFSMIKIDEFKNVVFPSYTIEDTGLKMKDEDKNISILTLTGMNKKLLINPLTHDKEGNKYDKPINSLEKGKSGLTILLKDGVETNNIKYIVTGENSIDNLSYAELKNIDLNKTALLSFNGSMKEEAIKAFTFLLEKTLPNVEKITMAFDNDAQGIKYDEKLKNIINEKSQNLNKSFEVIEDKSDTKDWNEDLKLHKQKLMTNRDKTLYKEGKENEKDFI